MYSTRRKKNFKMRININSTTNYSDNQKYNTKNNLVNFGTLLRGFPRNVEIGVSKNCNLKCSYCPNKFLKGNPPEQIMSMPLFIKILKDLKKMGYDGRFAFHRFNEPLLVEVEKYIRIAKEILPKITAELSTNGTLLDKSRLESLQKTPIDKIIVTQHTKKGFIDRLDEIPDDLLKNVHVKYAEDLSLVNRGGVLGAIENPLGEPCYAIKSYLVVNSNGQVPLCIDDYYSTVILGDLNKESVEELWNNPFAQKLREELFNGNRKKFDVCKECDRTTSNRILSQDLNKNDAIYRKRLLLATGSAHLKPPVK